MPDLTPFTVAYCPSAKTPVQIEGSKGNVYNVFKGRTAHYDLIGFVSVQVGSSDLMWTASTLSRSRKQPVSGTSSLAQSLTRETVSVLVVASLLTSSRCGVDTMATFYKNCDHRGRWKGDPLDFHRVKVVNRFYDQRKTREEVISLLESLGFELIGLRSLRTDGNTSSGQPAPRITFTVKELSNTALSPSPLV